MALRKFGEVVQNRGSGTEAPATNRFLARGAWPPNQLAYSFEDSGFCTYFQTLDPTINAWPKSTALPPVLVPCLQLVQSRDRQYKNILLGLPKSLGRPLSNISSLAKINERRMQLWRI